MPLFSPKMKNRVMLKYLFFSFVIFVFSGNSVYSQKIAISTNAVDYVNLFTLNGTFSYAVTRNMTMEISMRYNPFVYNLSDSDRQMQNKRLAFYTGMRYWPWHVYSGWFISGNMNYTRFNTGGIFSEKSYEGDAYALAFGGGYALMLSSKFNLDFALSVMAGYGRYRRYSCPSCGLVEANKKQVFIAPDNILVQLSYLF